MKDKFLLALAFIIPGLAITLLLTPPAPVPVLAGRFLGALCLAGLCYAIIGFMAKNSLRRPVNIWLRLIIAHTLAAIAILTVF